MYDYRYCVAAYDSELYMLYGKTVNILQTSAAQTYVHLRAD